MKKIPFVCLILALCLVFAMPTAAYATGGASTLSGDSHIFLTNPVAVAAIGDYVFIADNLESNHSVIFCFDVNGDAPVKIAEMEFDKQIVNVTELNGKLAVIFANEIVAYPLSTIIPNQSDDGGSSAATVSEDGEETTTPPESGEEGEGGENTPPTGGEGEEGEQPDPDDGNENGGEEEPTTPPDEGGDENESATTDTYEISGAVDVTYGTVQSNLGDGNTLDTISYISNANAQYLTASAWQNVFSPSPNAKAATFFNGYFYYAFGGGVKRFNGMTDASDFNNKLTLANNFVPTGILIYNADGARLALFDGANAYRVDTSASGFTATVSIFANGSSVDGNIVDMCFAASKLFVLNDNHKVEIFTAHTSNNGTFVKDADVSIGTETIGLDTPTEFTGFTKAKSLGYPTNIIYRTSNTENSIENIVPDCKDVFTILDFAGAAELGYYYVMYGNKFGWVRKSIGATTPETDAKIQIINNNVSTPDSTYTSHFTSLNAVYIYNLPQSGSEYVTLNQTIDNPIEFTFLQKFEEVKADGTTAIWFYIEYGEDEHGFIMDGTYGPISSKALAGEKCTDLKINSSLFEAVKIYLTSDMTAGQEICDEDGNVIKLYSGKSVEAMETVNGATRIQVRYNGKLVKGWMPADNLIAPNRLTTNAIVGISLLSAAIVLAITLVAVFVHRKKHKEGNARNQGADDTAE